MFENIKNVITEKKPNPIDDILWENFKSVELRIGIGNEGSVEVDIPVSLLFFRK